MPNDALLVRILSVSFLFSYVLTGVLFVGIAFQAFFIQPKMPKAHADDRTVYLCGPDEHDLGCALYVSRWLTACGICVVAFLLTYPVLAKHTGEQYHVKGARLNDLAFKMPARIALERLWWCARFCWALWGVCTIAFGSALHAAGEKAAFHSGGQFVSEIVMGVSWIISSYAFNDDNRRFFMAFLTAVNTEGETQSAACVAALLGIQKIQKIENVQKNS